MEFRKEIIRSSSNTDEAQQREDFGRINDVMIQIDELMYTYYGHNASYLPYTHDEVITDGKKTYIFNPEAADFFIEEMLSTIDEQYWNSYPLPDDFFEMFDYDTQEFYKSFLYLAIRIGAIKTPSKKPDGHHKDVGNGTFRDLCTLSNSIVIPYSEQTYHREFELGIPNPDLPQLFFDIQDICRALGRENCFFHAPRTSDEQEQALREDTLMKQSAQQFASDIEDSALDQVLASEEYLKESNDIFRQRENEELKKIISDFPDTDNFIKHACTFRDLLFRNNNHNVENYLDHAIKLFLLRNEHSVLSQKDAYLDTHEKITIIINEIKSLSNSIR